MKILNLRRGFATNSSSSHSVIMLPKDAEAPRSECETDFGWEYFTAASYEDKARYVAATLSSTLDQMMSKTMAGPIIRDWVKEANLAEDDTDHYVDHQSLIQLPLEYETWRPGLDKEFFMDLKKFMLSPRVVILGGNDNTSDDDDHHPLQGLGKEVLDIPTDGRLGMICRKDQDWWTFFNRETGYRSTFSLEEDPKPIKKFDAPLLADVKITNYCTQGCTFCYQDSTAQGKHAKMADIRNIAYDLSRLKVFEVAIGGGEPTSHPDFPEILSLFKHSGIVPNFTTREVSWMIEPSKEKLQKAVREYVGAIAFSVSIPDDVDAFQAGLEMLYNDTPKLDWGHYKQAIHVIPELLDEDTFRAILERASKHHLQVTLLGLKHTGRGATTVACAPFDWLGVCQELQATWRCPKISIDTALARVSQDKLLEIDGEKVTWFTDEGGRSMYIDAVEMMAGASSYSDPKKFIRVVSHNPALKEVFKYLPVEE